MRELQESGRPVPFLENAPQLYPWLQWIWDAFQDLSCRRLPSQAGPAPIPMSEILAYAEYHGIHSTENRQLLAECLSVMDDVFLKFTMEQIKKASKKTKAKTAK